MAGGQSTIRPPPDRRRWTIQHSRTSGRRLPNRRLTRAGRARDVPRGHHPRGARQWTAAHRRWAGDPDRRSAAGAQASSPGEHFPLMLWLSIAGGVFLAWLILVFLFTPGINYRLSERTSIHERDFLYTLQSTCQAALHHGNAVTVFTNGSAFYPAMLDAIGKATRSINMELYIFQPGKIADQFVAELSARARAGVTVTIVVDAIGSLTLWGRPLRRLRRAGCRIESYQRLRWYSLARLNNRTHRELLIIDGKVAFIGGAGIADWWVHPSFKRMRWHKPWRDTMARIDGPVVAALQGVAAENWLECCGEILTAEKYFPSLSQAGDTTAFVVKSSPSDRATASRVTFQTLMEGADHSIHINTPYFLPDRSLRRALMETAQRGVKVTVIV